MIDEERLIDPNALSAKCPDLAAFRAALLSRSYQNSFSVGEERAASSLRSAFFRLLS
jgi:hypothetical protein